MNTKPHALDTQHNRIQASLTGLLAVALLSPLAVAQCDPDWIETPGFGYAGVHGNVKASIMWDPDGLGPEPELLVIGGMFDAVDSVPAGSIAAWDGETWTSLDGGVTEGENFLEGVSSLTVYEGKLIVGGHFGKAGDVVASNIAAWDGTTWQPLGGGIHGGFSEPTVLDMVVHDGKLYAVGAFNAAGNISANFIASWDGTSWASLGSGASFVVFTVESYGNDLFIGGQFTSAGGISQTKHLARWDGTNWNSVGNADNLVWDIHAFNGDLYIGGRFTFIGFTQAKFIAKRDGSDWTALGSGTTSTVSAITSFQGDLHVGGTFQGAGGQSANNIARWDGANWHALDQGAGNQNFGNGVKTLTPRGSQLFVGGGFQVAGGETASGMALWHDEEGWTSFGGRPLNIEARGLEIFEGDLVVSGYAGLDRSSKVIRWDGLDWTAIGNTFNELVWDIDLHDDELYALGWFNQADGNPAAGIARWDGTEWTGLGSGLSGGYVTSALAMSSFGGDLIVGGDFTSAGGVAANHIARWDGTDWHPLGNGIGDAYSFVWELLEFEGDLVAIGEYALAGGAPANGAARWDGSSWSPLGGGLTGGILPGAEVAVIFEGDLVVGGTFTHAGGAPAMNIARWDGSQWHAIGAGFPEHGVTALTVYNGRLYTGGQFIFNDESNTRIAVWNGTTWETLGGGVNGGVSDFALLESELIISGGFSIAGETVAPGLARWSDTITPWFVQQPMDAEACLGETRQFEAALALGYETATLQWQRNGEPLTDGPTGYGSMLSGAATGTLTITDIHAPDAAIYVCFAENSCESAPSDEVQLTMCLADYNCDGSVNTLDVLAYLNGWNAGDTHADINGDGTVNTLDVLAFLNAWSAGC